jgi:hypothetical protein
MVPFACQEGGAVAAMADVAYAARPAKVVRSAMPGRLNFCDALLKWLA